MESYLVSSLFHRSLSKWYSCSDYQDTDTFPVSDFFTPLSLLLTQVFKQHSFQHVLLIATDGRVCSVKSMDDPSPESFKIRRYMKIDNRSSLSNLSHVISFLYQLLSIDMEENSISILDTMGLLTFVSNFIQENDLDASEWNKLIRRCLWGVPGFVKDRVKGWKEIRDTILDQFLNKETMKEQEALQFHETMLEHLASCQRMIQRLSDTIGMQDERISWLEEKLVMSCQNKNNLAEE